MSSGSELVLVWTPSGRDGALAVELMIRHGFTAQQCTSLEQLLEGIPTAGCAIVTSEVMTEHVREELVRVLGEQPPWSDFPLILFAPRGTDRASDAFQAMQLFGNIAVLERPVHSRTLVSAVMSALRGRRRQYEAREAIRRRDQFLAMLGHELRNPLAAIVLALEMLHGVSADVGIKQRTIIDRQVRHLARLVDDLLDVARVTSGKITLKRDPIDLNDVVRRCLQGAELAARARSTELRVTPASEPLVVDGDLVRLEEIFNNLISNAIKYSPEHARIHIITRHDRGQHVVEVIDNGIGIDPGLLPNVFELFAQADVTLDRSQGGLGIGLTLVRSLVELHGGSVNAQSEGLGSGSRFIVRLPTSTASVRPQTSHLTSVPAEIPRLRVVLVEDNLDLLEMTKDLLELHGCTVFTASDGPTGLARVLTEGCDIAFIDIGLPELDGLQLARRLRSHGTSHPYLVAMTGYGQPEDRRRTLEAGFDDHIVKPITLEVIERTLRKSTRSQHSNDGSQSLREQY